jgi:hypothetical protein
MTSSHSDGSANLMQELYFELLKDLNLLEPLNQVPFQIQQRHGGFTPAMRCLSLLASRAQHCHRLTDWTLAQRLDSRLQHWLGDRPAPHPSTLSRTLAATLTQMLRQEAIVRQEPIPAGLQETLTAAADSGLRFKHDATAGRILIETITGAYTKTFKKLIRCSRQHRFKFAA